MLNVLPARTKSGEHPRSCDAQKAADSFAPKYVRPFGEINIFLEKSIRIGRAERISCTDKK